VTNKESKAPERTPKGTFLIGATDLGAGYRVGNRGKGGSECGSRKFFFHEERSQGIITRKGEEEKGAEEADKISGDF